MSEKEAVGVKLSSKKLIIIIAVGLVFMLAGGAGVYFLMKGPLAGAEDDKHKKHEEKPALYFDLSKPFLVDLSGGESSFTILQVALTFMVEDEESVGALKQNEPMIRNNLLMIFSAQNPDKLNTTEGKEILRGAILKEVSAILKKLVGESEVKEVLFTSFVLQ